MFQFSSIQGVLFDVDGTLYRQFPLRAFMILEILKFILVDPRNGWKTAQILRKFRKEREALRRRLKPGEPLKRVQYEAVALPMKIPIAVVEKMVSDWIMERPLKHIRKFRTPGIEHFLAECKRLGIKIGTFSDYPTKDKIEKLGLSEWFDLHLCSLDSCVNAFKPSSKGIKIASEYWGIRPSNMVYVGDRPEIDGVAAKEAGAQFIRVGKPNRVENGEWQVKDFYQLISQIDRNIGP